MRTTLLFISTLFYLVFTSGLIVNAHYCMDKLSSTELFGKQAETCGTCGMEENEGCCHSETNLFVLEDDHFASYHSFGIKSLSPVLTVTPDFEVADLVVRHKHYTTPINAPPGDKEPVYLINRVFRI